MKGKNNFTTFGDSPQSRLDGYSAARSARASSSNRPSIMNFSKRLSYLFLNYSYNIITDSNSI